MPRAPRPASSAVAHTEGALAAVLSRVKNSVVRAGSRPRHVRSGVFKGLRMHIDLSYQAQVCAGLYERELHTWLRRFARGAESAIDVGAAEGSYLLYFLERTQVSAVYAFEPDPQQRTKLRANLALNARANDPRLKLSKTAVGASDNPGSATLDTACAVAGRPCVIKIDVEGSEVDVLDGARRLLSDGDVRWIVETHSVALERECMDRFQQHRYETVVVEPAWWRVVVPERRPIEHNRWLVAYRKGLMRP